MTALEPTTHRERAIHDAASLRGFRFGAMYGFFVTIGIIGAAVIFLKSL